MLDEANWQELSNKVMSRGEHNNCCSVVSKEGTLTKNRSKYTKKIYNSLYYLSSQKGSYNFEAFACFFLDNFLRKI